MGEDAVEAMPAHWQGERRRLVIDEVAVVGANTAAAVAFLVVLGMLVAGQPLAGAGLLVVGIGVVVDLLSEVWLYQRPYRYSDARIRRLILVHYGFVAAAYAALAGAVAGVAPVFWLYTGFMVFWMAGFLLGEMIVIFIDDRYEHADQDLA